AGARAGRRSARRTGCNPAPPWGCRCTSCARVPTGPPCDALDRSPSAAELDHVSVEIAHEDGDGAAEIDRVLADRDGGGIERTAGVLDGPDAERRVGVARVLDVLEVHQDVPVAGSAAITSILAPNAGSLPEDAMDHRAG